MRQIFRLITAGLAAMTLMYMSQIHAGVIEFSIQPHFHYAPVCHGSTIPDMNPHSPTYGSPICKTR